MRWLVRSALFIGGTILLVPVLGFCWLYFYTRDLPDISRLAQYAPTTSTQVSDPCIGNSTAIPYESIGANVRNAISAVETSETDPGVLRSNFHVHTENTAVKRRTVIASVYLSRTMCTMCYPPSSQLQRELAELRTAAQMERRYSRKRLFTMYANAVYFGPTVIGVQQGSEFYFHKSSGELNLPEAALLAGLLKGPSIYSPTKHPDRALHRRNEVLEAMVENGSITADDARTAKAAPLGVAIGISTSCCTAKSP
jgi:penicillin-binding protein 1A